MWLSEVGLFFVEMPNADERGGGGGRIHSEGGRGGELLAQKERKGTKLGIQKANATALNASAPLPFQRDTEC